MNAINDESIKFQEHLPIEEIVTMSYDGFEVNTQKMKTGEIYDLVYDDSHMS